jgi:hypothetical protein
VRDGHATDRRLRLAGRLMLAGLLVGISGACREPAQAQRAQQAAQAQRAQQIVVSNDLTLRAALGTARAGSTIVVKPGDYGLLNLKNRRFEGRPLRIVGSGDGPATFAGADLSGAEQLVISGLSFSAPVHPVIRMQGARNILFAGNHVTGAEPDGDPWNNGNSGIHIRESGQITLYGNRFNDLRGTAWIQRSQDVIFSRNSISQVREGLNVAATQNLSIDGNDFRDFSPIFARKEHPDAIQFWTSRETQGSSDVRIRDNVILMGGCKAVQGIFIRSETEGRNDGGVQVRHRNFTIQRNLYYGSSRNGLSVSSVDEALVENNVIVGSPYGLSGTKRADVTDPRCGGSLVPGILSRNGTETHRFLRNVTNIMGKTDGVSDDNIALSGRGSSKWTDVFVAQPMDDMPDVSAFLTRPGSRAHKRGIGLLRIAEHGAPADARQALEAGLALHAELEAR